MGLCSFPVVWPEATLSTEDSTGDSWTLTAKSNSVSCGNTAPLSQLLVHTGPICALQESVSPVLWKFCNQISLASKVKFPGGSQSLCRIPGSGNLLWVLELSQQCGNFFGIIVCSLCVPCLAALWWEILQDPDLLQPEPHGRPLLTHAFTGDTRTLKSRSDSLCGNSGSWCTQGFVWAQGFVLFFFFKLNSYL